jgi:hypothetical protein
MTRPRITIQIEGQVVRLEGDRLTVQVGLHEWPGILVRHLEHRRPAVGQWVSVLMIPATEDTRPVYTVENPPTIHGWGKARIPAGHGGKK